MPQPDDETRAILPVVEEQLSIEKRIVETGRVRIRTVVDEQVARVSEELAHDDVTIERVAVNQEVGRPPQIREENGVLIVPVLEEVLVVEKRLMLKEELHVRKNQKRERVEQAVRVRKMRPEVQRKRSGAAPDQIVPTNAPGAELQSTDVSARRAPRLRRKEALTAPRK